MTPPVLKTRRLTLRPITLADAPAIARGMSNWDVVQWLTAPPFPYSVADAEYFITENVPEAANWAIDAGEGLIGTIGVKPDLGYWLDVAYHGQHIMSEASEAAVAWYFGMSDKPLISGHLIENRSSARVLSKLGFQNTEIVEEMQTATNALVKLQRMALSKQGWEQRRAKSALS